METIKEGKQYLRDNWNTPGGCTCPCCGQRVKLYKRKIHKGMAVDLIRVYREQRRLGWTEFIHVEKYLQSTGKSYSHNFALAEFWGLAERSKAEPEQPAARTGGLWRLTALGREFVAGRMTVPKFVYTFNHRKYYQSDERVNIRTALTDQLNYDELMNETY